MCVEQSVDRPHPPTAVYGSNRHYPCPAATAKNVYILWQYVVLHTYQLRALLNQSKESYCILYHGTRYGLRSTRQKKIHSTRDSRYASTSERYCIYAPCMCDRHDVRPVCVGVCHRVRSHRHGSPSARAFVHCARVPIVNPQGVDLDWLAAAAVQLVCSLAPAASPSSGRR